MRYIVATALFAIAATEAFNDNGMMPAPNPRLARVAAVLFLSVAAIAPALAAEAGEEPSLAATAGATVKAAAVNAIATAEKLSLFALGMIGVSYRWGGSTPDTGLDCSGLVRYVFQQVTGVTLPHSARELSRVGRKVGVDDLEPGDLVFFNTRRFAFSHVGIYLGDKRFLHAPAAGRDVEIATLDKSYWLKRFNGARRLVGVLPALMPRLVAEAVAAPVETTDPQPDETKAAD
jgi:cell wall-associated NlpC family hydrolase